MDQIKFEQKKLVNIMVYRSKSQRGLSDINISIREIGIEGVTERGGTFMFEVTDDMDLNKWITIQIDNKNHNLHLSPGYKEKNLRVKLKDIVNRTKVILLEPKLCYSPRRLKEIPLTDFDYSCDQ